jgi:hypothetical protein
MEHSGALRARIRRIAKHPRIPTLAWGPKRPSVGTEHVKIGIITEPTANGYYRAILPLRVLEQRGHTVLWPSDSQDVPMRRLEQCDLVHCYRRLERLGDLNQLSQRGIAITFDNDDNYEAAETSEIGGGLAGHRYNRTMARAVRQAVRLADTTTTPSHLLAEKYAAAGARRVEIIPNRVTSEMPGFGGQRPRRGRIVVGWLAAREHDLDAERVPIVSALRQELANRNDLEVVSLGLRVAISSPRYTCVPEVRFVRLLTALARFDIGVAPLADTVFNRCRSDVKLREYAAARTAWLASPVGPYSGYGRHEGGVLVADTNWPQALHELITNARKRRALAARGLRWARREALERNALDWEQCFLAAVEHAYSRRSRHRPGPHH